LHGGTDVTAQGHTLFLCPVQQSLCNLDPDGCLVRILLPQSHYTMNIRVQIITGRQPFTGRELAKKARLFCIGVYFSLDKAF
jgi:hypothetical protein